LLNSINRRFTMFENVKKVDEEVYNSIQREIGRQDRNLELIASENIVSDAVLEAMGSQLTNKYAEGYPNKRYYGGCEFVDEVEILAIERLKKLFNAEHANVQPHSGSNANIAVYFAFLNPGDKILGMNLSEGGHLTHGSPVNMSGKHYEIIPYGVDKETETIDYDKLREIALKEKPKMIIAGASAYSRTIDFKKFREIADEVDAILMVDMAHIAGLIAAGLHPNPVEYADVVTTTTHKTLRGPRGGAILCKEEHAKKIDKAIFPGIQGGPLMHIIAAKAVSFKEALTDDFKEYQKQIIKNAKRLSEEFTKRDFRVVSGGTDTHLMLLDLRSKNITGKKAEALLDEINITVNKNTVPEDPESPFVTSGIRVGTPTVTTLGLKEDDMAEIADIINDAILENQDQETLINRVKLLTEKYNKTI